MQKIIIFILILSSFNAFCDENWKHLYAKDNLNFFSKESNRGSLLVFMAKGQVDVSTPELLSILRNVEGTTKWDSDTKKKVTIKDISDIEALTYSITHIPWPFNDRDLVLRNLLVVDPKKKVLQVNVNSIELAEHPKDDDYVRAYLEAKMQVRPKDENTTFVQLEVLVDPRGAIPKWVVNMVQKDMPYNFLKGIENYSKTGEFKPNPGVTKLYNDLIVLLNTGEVPKF